MPFSISFGALLILLFAVVLVRTLRFVPQKRKPRKIEKIAVDLERATEELSELIGCRTVSNKNPDLEDRAEFERMPKLLAKLFPAVHKTMTLEMPSDRSLLFRWRGEGDGAPTVIMAHYDVVSADESAWTRPAFSGTVDNGFLYGRGALDTKLTLSTSLHAAEMLITEGFVPKNDVYFAFGGDEEISGKGAVAIVDLFERRGIYPSLVLDEGGAVVKGIFPGVKRSAALIGIAEKGMADVLYTAKSSGGHASTPKGHTPVTRLARAATRVATHPFPFRLTEPTRLMLDRVTRHSTFGYRMIFGNLWLFAPVLNLITREGGELGAIVRTTVAFTEMHGAYGTNVIPPEASLVSNQRILPGETPESVREHLERAVADSEVKVNILSAQPPSRVSRVDCAEYEKVEETAQEVWQNAVVSPYLMLACSDSRHWGRLSDRVYRFSPMEFVGDERASIHGNDERVSLSSIEKSVEFFYRFIKKI